MPATTVPGTRVDVKLWAPPDEVEATALEQLRNITNKTWICRPDSSSTNSNGMTCTTNTPWLPMTDSSNQVASLIEAMALAG